MTTPTPDLVRLLRYAQAAQQRGDHATYCAAWGRIDRELDAMLEEGLCDTAQPTDAYAPNGHPS